MLHFRISCSNRKFAYNFNSNGSIHDLSMTDQVYKMQKTKKEIGKTPRLILKQIHHQLQDALDVGLATQAYFLQLIMTLYVETHVWTYVCIGKTTSSVSCSWWWLCYLWRSIFKSEGLKVNFDNVFLVIGETLPFIYYSIMEGVIWFIGNKITATMETHLFVTTLQLQITWRICMGKENEADFTNTI